LDISHVAEKYALGTISVEDLPGLAADVLEAGYDAPSLRRLAASQGRDREEIRRTFAKTLQEFGTRMPSQEEAVLSAARRIARSVLEGEISPYQGARRIWWDLYSRFGQPESLSGFVGLASEYEDAPKHQDEISRHIIEECERILLDTN
jgi:hypothetical protein